MIPFVLNMLVAQAVGYLNFTMCIADLSYIKSLSVARKVLSVLPLPRKDADRPTDRQTDRQTDRHRERERERERERTQMCQRFGRISIGNLHGCYLFVMQCHRPSKQLIPLIFLAATPTGPEFTRTLASRGYGARNGTRVPRT